MEGGSPCCREAAAPLRRVEGASPITGPNKATRRNYIMMPHRKVPAGFLALIFVLAGCGGDAESAADPGGVPVLEDGVEEIVEGTPDPSVIPPSRAPMPEPETRPAPAAPAPPPVSEVPEDRPSDDRSPEEEVLAISVGTRLVAAMESEISTRTHEAGAPFQARVNEPILGANGRELVPAGARVEGRVLEARGTTDQDVEAVLVLAVETLVVGGARFPLRATVEAADIEATQAASGTRSAAKVATGAAAGAVIGQILGRDTRSTVTGAAAGAAAGAGVALTTRGGHATILEGARLTLRVDEPVLLAGVH